MAKNHPASHAARKGISGSPHMKGMPANYLAGHTEDHMNAHNSGAGKLMRTHDHLQEAMGGGGGGEPSQVEQSEM